MVIYSYRKAMPMAREKLNMKPIEYAKNSIDFLNRLSEDDLKKSNAKDKISIMTWERKVINKHHHLDTVHAKVGISAHQLELFIESFDPLFKKGIPFVWREKAVMLTKDAYYEKLIERGKDHLNCRYDSVTDSQDNCRQTSR